MAYLFAKLLLLGVAGLPQATPAVPKCDDFLLIERQYEARGDHFRSLLNAHRYAALQDELGARQARIEAGQESDETLRLDLTASFNRDPAQEPLLSEWIRAYPNSYVAHLARAYHHVDRGYARRGTEFASETAREQFDAMDHEFELALEDLEIAERLSSVPTLAYAERLEMLRSRGRAAKLLKKANHKFPKSLAIKIEATWALDPRWGGSFEELDELVDFAETAGLRPIELATLKYYVEITKGHYYEQIERRNAPAGEHYRRAGAICDAFLPWEDLLRVASALEDFPNVILAADNLIRLNAGYAVAYVRRGWAYDKTGRTAESIQQFQIASDLGEPWAQNRIGWLLWRGDGLPEDRRRAKKLFEAAAAQGNRDAQANLKALNGELAGKPQKP